MIYLFLIILAILNSSVRTLTGCYIFHSKFKTYLNYQCCGNFFKGLKLVNFVQWHHKCRCNTNVNLFLSTFIDVDIYFMHTNENTFLRNAVPRSPYKFTENMLAENTLLL